MLLQAETEPMLRPFCLLIFIGAASALAAPMYEVTDENGHVTYTDKPPADTKDGDNKAIEQKPLNVLESQPGRDYQKSYEHNQSKVQQKRETAWDNYDQALYDAQQKLKSAQKAQKEGEEMKEGDMIATYGRKRGSFMRPTEEWLERQEQLKRAVSEAEAELNAVKKNKPMLRRN